MLVITVCIWDADSPIIASSIITLASYDLVHFVKAYGKKNVVTTIIYMCKLY